MSYATANDLLIWYGAKELTQIAVPEDRLLITPELLRLTIDLGDRGSYTPEERASADEGLIRIERGLSDAHQLMNSYLARRYPLPLSNDLITASALPRSCGAIARRLLHLDRVPAEVIQGYEMALSWLKDLAANKAELQHGAITIGAGLAAFDAADRVFDQTTLSGFA